MTDAVKRKKRERSSRSDSLSNAWMDALVYLGEGLLFPVIGSLILGGIVAAAFSFDMLPQVLGILLVLAICGPITWALGSDGFLFEALGVGALVVVGFGLAVHALGFLVPILFVLGSVILILMGWALLSALFA